MALSIVNEVWEHAPLTGTQLLVALALADNANKDNRSAWPGVEDLASRARVSTRQVRTVLRRLEEVKVVEREERPGRTAVYTFTDPGLWLPRKPTSAPKPHVPRKVASPPTPEADFPPPVEEPRKHTSGHPGSPASEPRKPTSAEPLEPSLNLGQPPSNEGGAQQLVAHFVDKHKRRPPGQVIGQVAKHVGALLAEGFEAHHIRAGLDALVAKAMHPSTLPVLVNEAANDLVRNRGRPAVSSHDAEMEANRDNPDYWLRRAGT